MLKYGNANTFTYRLSEEELIYINKRIMNAYGQIEWLYNLVNGCYDSLLDLISKMRNNFIAYLPDTKEEVDIILKMSNVGYFKW